MLVRDTLSGEVFEAESVVWLSESRTDRSNWLRPEQVAAGGARAAALQGFAPWALSTDGGEARYLPVETLADVESLSALDLRKVALDSVRRGETVVVYRRKDRRGQMVETLVVGGRAGQAAGGDATWGDWDARAEVLRPDGEGVALRLDGSEA